MKLKPIVNSLLENDLYKFNMGNVIYKKFNDYETRWTFKCRNDDVRFTPEMVEEIGEQLRHYCTLRFREDEIRYLKTACPWLSQGYLNYLKFWHPVLDEIVVQGTYGNVFDSKAQIVPYNNCGLAIETCGTWVNTSMYEIAILAIVNEVYFAFKYGDGALDANYKANTYEKVKGLNAVGDEGPKYDIGAFSEFGMRRRLSANMQDWLIGYLKASAPGFIGTSNVWLAKVHDVKPVGTQAHEYFMAFQSKFDLNPTYTNWFALKTWVDEYQTLNGTALTDTLGTDLFLKDFGLTFATLFSGVRHDSGDPIEWGEKMISHYKKLGIDPEMKTLLFSDSLNFERATKIKKHFDGRCRIAFGIGTYLANDTGVEPLNIVMKMTECNGSPVAKISNTPGKGMCRDAEYEDYLKRAISWRMKH